ncbi:MAG: B12-binding domain-containing radical SAM protein [Gammaproteobacteria bacterium]|nr:B12-binding domain-containing radical SAM protein [Gammaproteobacteria bacterium]MDH5802952.1 B12-binding domain-containing radical SAM protein [Gammaproteobacteria bacterium]
MTIVLSTLNARYIHSALGLRYLKAHMGSLEAQTRIVEFDLQRPLLEIAEALLQLNPTIVGFGVYIWNVEETTRLIAILKKIQPKLTIVIGGPEVSYEFEQQGITQLCDYLITGAADLAFVRLCETIVENLAPAEKIIHAQTPSPKQLQLPYYLYTQEDIENRVLYIEASRGCPFKCEFCLSALDKTSTGFELEPLLRELDLLIQRGARQFKFVDRTFNLNTQHSSRILQFFLDRMDLNLFIHFEVIPDHLPEKLKLLITQFPPGSLQFELGIQSFDPQTQERISRKQNNEKTCENLLWLRQHTSVHLHTDLILGLPGETLSSIAKGFNQLQQLEPQEIQVGILKRLRGTPIIRHTQNHQMVYNPNPPYNLICSDTLDFATMQRLTRFARYWDLVGNSARFKYSLPLLLDTEPFQRFLYFSDSLFSQTGQTHRFSLKRLYEYVHSFLHKNLTRYKELDAQIIDTALLQDYLDSGLKSTPTFIDKKQYLELKRLNSKQHEEISTGKRQQRHINP